MIEDFVKKFSHALRALGLLVCCAVITLGVLLSVHFPMQIDFWTICHALSLALLLIFFGIGTAYTEARALWRLPNSKLGFFKSRFSLAIAYGWVGCYCVGGVLKDDGWQTLARGTGFAAWATGIGNLIFAFCILKF